ncbi:2-dehydro-3-deoxygalactonokinase [Pseudoroseomonas globiformis]|uniref:2-dehydro-3-deoxygalactonokinase n=1 Tax=Teichococcus globiformis TaxID=2307229 RepID=A0ABV7FUN1_9PROT
MKKAGDGHRPSRLTLASASDRMPRKTIEDIVPANASRAPGQAALIALDWGTSSLRGFLLDAAGTVLEQRASPHGITNLPEPGEAGFEAAFSGLCGEWRGQHPGVPVVACGMVGSAQGWKEAPYANCPADARLLASKAAEIRARDGSRILVAPGLTCREADMPDVMRGEEIQVAGALFTHPQLAEHSLLVMPGTHSKWVTVEGGRITRFASHMTGEVFAVLRRHSILGRLMPEEAAPPDTARAAFSRGLAMGADGGPGLLHQIFATRTLGLTDELPGAALGDFLSGLLIGHEVAAGLRGRAQLDAPIALIGELALCERYAEALSQRGVSAAAMLGNTAPAGLFHFATAAGLLAAAPEITA